MCNEAFIFSERSQLTDTVITSAANSLNVDVKQTQQMLSSLGVLLKTAVFHGYTQPAELQALFPGDFHKNLRDLLVKIMIENMGSWKNYSINNQVSLPRLIDFDWRVDIKTSSDTITRMSVPTCILQMKVQDMPCDTNITPDVTNVNVELSKETLDTMLDGLSKIRDQLSSVASR